MAVPLWLEIDDEPTVALWRDPSAAVSHGAALGWPLLASVQPIRQPLLRPAFGGGEAANASVTLDDTAGTLAAYWRDTPPVRRRARIMTSAGALFDGVVTSFSVGSTAQLSLQGAAAWALTDPLPLRTSAVWGEWHQVRALPLIYGRATIEPIPYDREGQLFLVADHPIDGIDRVVRDDAPTDAWSLRHGPDSTGRMCAWLELATPLAPGERLRADVRGKRHRAHGALLREPHEILEDVLVDICGLPIEPGAVQRLRTEYPGWHIGVAFTSVDTTIRQAIDRICGSIGAAWSLGSTDIARRWPADTGAALALVDVNATAASASVAHADIATVVRVLYDVSDHDGQPRRAVQIGAPEAIARYGRIEREWTAACLREPWQAHDLARRLLTWYARPIWTLRWSMPDKGGLRVGDTVTLAHPHLPVQGDVVLCDVQRDPMRASLQCEAQVPSGTAPQIVVERLSRQVEPLLRAGTAVEYLDGTATFTLLGEHGEPLAGAKVILDGTTVRYANTAGRVSFKAARGRHTLHVQAAGYAPMDIEVEV